jgi:hypothetical protein
MSNEQQQIIDKVYEDALMEYGFESLPSTPEGTWFETIETFIHKCKIDNEFSEKWGLKIDERELSLEERKIHMSKYSNDRIYPHWDEKFLNEKRIPTKIITITYNDKTIESYE